jgi:hypothetical protein
MLIQEPHPLTHLTPDEMTALIRRAHAERSAAFRDFVLGLLRRKPAAEQTEPPPSLNTAACH